MFGGNEKTPLTLQGRSELRGTTRLELREAVHLIGPVHGGKPAGISRSSGLGWSGKHRLRALHRRALASKGCSLRALHGRWGYYSIRRRGNARCGRRLFESKSPSRTLPKNRHRACYTVLSERGSRGLRPFSWAGQPHRSPSRGHGDFVPFLGQASPIALRAGVTARIRSRRDAGRDADLFRSAPVISLRRPKGCRGRSESPRSRPPARNPCNDRQT